MNRRKFLQLTGLAVAGVAVGVPEVGGQCQIFIKEMWLRDWMMCRYVVTKYESGFFAPEIVQPIVTDKGIKDLRFCPSELDKDEKGTMTVKYICQNPTDFGYKTID